MYLPMIHIPFTVYLINEWLCFTTLQVLAPPWTQLKYDDVVKPYLTSYLHGPDLQCNDEPRMGVSG